MIVLAAAVSGFGGVSLAQGVLSLTAGQTEAVSCNGQNLDLTSEGAGSYSLDCRPYQTAAVSSTTVVNLNGSTTYSVPVSPAANDLVVVNDTATNTAPATISGGDVLNWANAYTGNNGSVGEQIAYGTAATGGSSRVKLTFASGVYGRIEVQEFAAGSAGTAVTWGLDTTSTASGTSSTVTFPALTPAIPDEVYVGGAWAMSGSWSAGSTPGFVYPADSMVYGTNYSTAVPPTADVSAGTWEATGVLFNATATATAAEPKSPSPASYFTTKDIFNVTVQNAGSNLASGWTVDPNSSTLVSNFVLSYQNSGGSVSLEPSEPIVYASANTPLVPVTEDSGQNCHDFENGTQPGPTGSQIPIPAAAEGLVGGSGDSPLNIIQPSTGKEWELWQAGYSSTSGWSACWGGEELMPTSDGFFPGQYGVHATGDSALADTITEQDVLSGSINHALAINVTACNGSIYPAVRGDCGSSPGYPAEGQWFVLPGSVNCGNYDQTKMEEMVCVALQKYGMMVDDLSGSTQIIAEDPADWQAQGDTGAPPVWTTLPNGHVVEENGEDPISLAEYANGATSGQMVEQYSVIAPEPWNQLEAIDPPAGY